MTSPIDRNRTIDHLLSRGRLELIAGDTVARSAELIVGRARRRLLTAEGGLAAGDVDGAFAAAYDAYRMAAEALLIRQGLRATGGEGSHITVEDAVSSQFGSQIRCFAKPTFERLRRTRHAAQYFDPTSADISADDSAWALSTARSAVADVAKLLSEDPPRSID